MHALGEPLAQAAPPPQIRRSRSTAIQFVASVQRQLRLASRKPCSLCIETLLPVVFVLLFALLSRLTSNTDYPDEIFATNPPLPALSMADTVRQVACFDVTQAPASHPLNSALSTLLPACSTFGQTTTCGKAPDFNPGLCYSPSSIGSLQQYVDFTNATTIPSLDYITLVHVLSVAVLGNPDYRFAQPLAKNAIRASGRIFFVPDAQPTRDLVSYLNSSGSSLLFQPYLYGGIMSSQSDAFAYFKSEAGAGKALAVVTVNSFSATAGLSVELSFNKSSIEWTNRDQNRFSGKFAKNYLTYFDSGFLTLEKFVLDAFVTSLGRTPDEFNTAGNAAVFAPMAHVSYTTNTFLTVSGLILPLALCLAYLYAVSQIAKRLVEEKELRLREAMAAMGVSKTTIFVSWLAFFFILNIVTAILATILMKATFVSKSNGVLIFLTMLLFSMTTSALGGLLSSFFSKSRTAAIATPILFFAFSIPSFALQSPSAQTVRALSILSPTAFATALQLIFNYEIDNGIGFGELFNKNDDVPLGQSLFMLIFDLVLYSLLTWYLDNVLSGEWGVRQHPCFCFLNCCRSKRAPSTPKDHDLGPTNVPRTLSGVGETYPPSVEDAAVVFDDVCKSFGEGEDLRVAVDRFSLKIFPGMVTAVLGHNGAGKTTLFNMLTGMLPTTDGDCYVCGASITTERDEARSYIGMCPQHNILWDDLTCLEHLRYFAWVKGTPHKDIDAEAQRLLEEVDLASKANARSSSLSGGQKRKLSVAIAFIGGSKLVLLDEPTAGMDVHTRRHTWDLIQKMARTDNRTIVLTTHFMDEAELLGDRVAMMTAGQLHCYGTPTFLKTRLGEGYTLAIQYGAPPTDETKARVLRENVCSIIRDAREKESRGREQFILLPMEDVAKFAQLLRSVESNEVKKRNGIVSVSMTVSTIEDVFVRIAHGEAGGDATAAKETARLQVDMNAANTAAQVIAAVETTPPTFLMQLVGLLKKRFNIAKRDRRALVLQVVLPILSILLAMALASAGPPGTSALIMDAHHLPDAQEGVTAGCSVGFNQGLGKSLTLINATTPSGAPSPGYFYTQEFLLSTYNHHGDTGRTVAIECMDATVPFTPSTSVPTVLISNSSAYIHAAPYSLVAWYTGRVNAGTPSSTTPPTIKIYNTPLPFTDRDSSKINGIAFALMAILIVVPFSFVPSTFCGFVVKERASKAKLLQFVSGVGYVAYWSSNMLFDLASFFVTEILAFIIFAAFSRTEYVGSGEAFFATFLVITMYGLAAIPTSYVMSLAFTNHSTAQNAVLGIFFLAGFGLTLTAYLLPLLNGPTWPVYLFRVFPPECLGEALIAIANAPGKRQIGVSLSLLDMDQAGWPLLYLGMMSIISTSVILFVDHPERIKRQQMLLYDTTKQAPSPASESPDVASERMEVEGPAGGGSDAVLRVVGLRKEYAAPAGSTASVNVAVQNLTFRVVRGEIFGLLGTNGAGKTTTMNVITGECLPSMGHAYVAGFDAVTQAGEARSLIGYCPQFDALHDLMTVDEHLALYCSLRGVRDPERISTALITAFGLSEYRRNKSKSLSGGNKRKLSVAIALVGGPQLLLLDEPTAGMDPVARRGMCDVVAAIKKHCAVVLTTHHLEEVEALADRAAIMVGGAMQCLGTLEHLKQTLGAGYQVSVRVSSEDKADACVARLCAEYPGQCKLVERHQTKLNFNVKHGDKVTLASLFDLLYNLRNAKDGAGLGVVDYTVAQSSVEEVFLAVAGGAKPHAVETYSVPMPAEASPPSPFHALL